MIPVRDFTVDLSILAILILESLKFETRNSSPALASQLIDPRRQGGQEAQQNA
jgi:hypothetical protein